MNHDAGIIHPENANVGAWVRRVSTDQLPAEIFHHFMVLVYTPGFNYPYFARTIGRSVNYYRKAYRLASTLGLEDEAMDNWNSVTEEDALLLIKNRPWRTHHPTVVDTFIATDMKSNMSHYSIAKKWGVTTVHLDLISRFGPFYPGRRYLPEWFKERVYV